MSYFDLFPNMWCYITDVSIFLLCLVIYTTTSFFFDEEKQKILMIEDQLVWGFMEMIY